MWLQKLYKSSNSNIYALIMDVAQGRADINSVGPQLEPYTEQVCMAVNELLGSGTLPQDSIRNLNSLNGYLGCNQMANQMMPQQGIQPMNAQPAEVSDVEIE